MGVTIRQPWIAAIAVPTLGLPIASTSAVGQTVIAVEAESFDAQRADTVRKWVRQDGGDPAPSGGAYVQVLPDTRVTHADPLVAGENFSNQAGQVAVLSYEVDLPSAGRWYVWTRAMSTGTEDNGLHVGVDGTWPESGQRIQFCQGKNRWFWNNAQRTKEQHCGVPGAIWLDIDAPGRHRIEFSMREDGFRFDAFALTMSDQPPPIAADQAPVRP